MSIQICDLGCGSTRNYRKQYGLVPNRLCHSPIARSAAVLLIALAWSRLAFCGEIHDAALNGNLARVNALLQGNPDLAFSKEDKFGATPLHLAAQNGHKDVAELLLANHADVNAKTGEGGTPLQLAAKNGHKDVAELLLTNKAEVDGKNNYGLTPLHHAAYNGHKDVVELLLAKGADVNAGRNVRATPLHLAAKNGHKDVAELLLANKAYINAKDKVGQTPLHYAAKNGHRDVVELLLACKADVNNEDDDGATPLHYAVENGHKSVIELLLANNAEVNGENNKGLVGFFLSNLSLAASVERSEIATLPTDYIKGSLVLSPDRKHYAFALGPSGVQRIVCDGVEGETFKACSLPIFSPTGQLFFWAVRDGKVLLSANGRVIETSLAGEGAIVFSKDGAHWVAFGAELGQRSVKTITPGTIVMFADSVEIARYSDITYPDFSRDGKHFAFLALDDDERMSLVVDGKVSTKFDKPTVECSFIMRASVRGPNVHVQASAHYLNNGGIVALVRDAKGWTVYKEGEALNSYPQDVWGGGGYTVMTFKGFDDAASIHGRSLVVAETAPVAAWWERPSGKGALWRVVIDGKPADSINAPNFWSAQPPVLSRDGKRIAYAVDFASAEGKKSDVHVIVDGIKNGPYSHVWGIRFSDDGKHFTYAASDGSEGDAWSYYRDGKPFANKYRNVYPPAFSLNGEHVAWKATRDKKQVLVLDGEEVATTEDALWGPEMDESGATSWVVREGNKVIRIAAKTK
jgi:ankyrin repeat protein